MEPKENFPLDEAALEMIAALDREALEINAAYHASIATLNRTLQVVLNNYIRKAGLQGNWKLAGNRRELELSNRPGQAQETYGDIP